MGNPPHLYDLVAEFWSLTRLAWRLGRRPVLGAALQPVFSSQANQAVMIPVDTVVHAGEHVALPHTVLGPMIREAGGLFVMADCICRRGEGCQRYPRDLGCLFMGEGAAGIHPSLGRQVSVDEALAHLQRATDAGLVPLYVHTRFDALVLGIPYRRMATVCFCCDCCCAIRAGLREGPVAFQDVVQPLPGLSVEVTGDCVQCELCRNVCPVGAISLDHDRAMIGGRCKGCGLCVAACPAGAIRLRLADEADVLRDLMARIAQHTDIGVDGHGAHGAGVKD